jgi:hypothetical protein
VSGALCTRCCGRDVTCPRAGGAGSTDGATGAGGSSRSRRVVFWDGARLTVRAGGAALAPFGREVADGVRVVGAAGAGGVGAAGVREARVAAGGVFCAG